MRTSSFLLSLVLSAFLMGRPVSAQDPTRFISRDPQIFVRVTSPKLLGDQLGDTGPFREILALLPEKDRDELADLERLASGIGSCLDGPLCFSANYGLLGQFRFEAAAATSLDLEAIEARLAQVDALPEKPRRRQRGDREVLSLGDELVATLQDGVLLVAGGLDDLQKMLALAEDRSAASEPWLIRLAAEAGSSEAFGCLKLGVLLKDDAARGMKADDFLGTILLEGLRRDLDEAERLFFQITTSPDIAIRLRMVGPAREEDWSTARLTPGTGLITALAGEVARLHVDRDIASFWRDREKLVTERALPGLAEFTQNLDTLLAGFSTAEFAAALEPGLDLIALEKSELPLAPEPLLPRLILAFQLRRDRSLDLDDRLRVGFQTAIGAINLGAGREHRRPYLQYSRSRAGHEILGARLVGPTASSRPGLADNFEPALTIVGDRLFIASDIEAATAAIDAALAEPGENHGDQLQLKGPGIAGLLLANRTPLENSRMLDEGETPEEASLFVDHLAEFARSIDRLVFRRISTKNGAVWDLHVQRSGDRR